MGFLLSLHNKKQKGSPSVSYTATFSHLLFAKIFPAARSVALNFLEHIELPQGKIPGY